VYAKPNAQKLPVVPEVEELNSSGSGVSLAAAKSVSCSYCFGAGMEIVTGQGARRGRDAQTTLLKAAYVPQRYSECSLSNYRPASNNGSQLSAFNYAYRLVCVIPDNRSRASPDGAMWGW
jgi:hypothetical protein